MLPGCTKPHRARGLCSTHYNQQHATPEQRHRKAVVQCTWCKTECVKDAGRERRYGGLFCSLTCRDLWRKATGNNPSPSPEAIRKGAVAPWRRRTVARRKLKRAARGTQGDRTWIAGPCDRCGSPFLALTSGADPARFCSARCAKRSSRARRRARERSAEAERYSRFAIFERDGWRCHICRRQVNRTAVVPHPLAPTIDHLLPLVAGGGDTAANVATAHFLCNSIKGDRAGGFGDQLALIG
ncbi:HNH endonuclease [Streptomyces mirabilis]|uniref:HNH endonuclease n=1 Tax=Streptomyces mirabilis TaxID=68239 RepID=UPI0036B3A828